VLIAFFARNLKLYSLVIKYRLISDCPLFVCKELAVRVATSKHGHGWILLSVVLSVSRYCCKAVKRTFKLDVIYSSVKSAAIRH